MKINAPKENYIFIELNKDDMEKLHITYDDMDYSQKQTRKVIKLLLCEVERYLGKAFTPEENFQVEALPSHDGGCLLFFTVREKKKHYILKGYTCEVIFETDDINNIFTLSESMKRSEMQNLQSELYENNKVYALKLKGRITNSIYMRLNELMYPSKTDISHAKLLIENDALGVLLSSLTQKSNHFFR